MLPIVIVQHEADVAPGTFELHLQARDRPYRVIRLHAGDALPESAEGLAGLCSLGGNMSVNDALPWIEPEIELMRDADRRGVPIIGHCLGGQLLARAFGAAVTRAAYAELGWGPVRIEDAAWSRDWLGESAGDVEFFQWHADTFALPAAARRVLTGAWCANQAFIIERAHTTHLGMQFHIEMTPELVRLWASDPSTEGEVEREVQRTGGPAVQAPAAMMADAEVRAARMARLAARLYDRWLRARRLMWVTACAAAPGVSDAGARASTHRPSGRRRRPLRPSGPGGEGRCAGARRRAASVPTAPQDRG
jgi:GMP synthase-like glutamine amidotransferase